MKKDILNRQDIEHLVDSFYEKVRADDTIGYIFDRIIGNDWSHHLPVMYRFWETVLFAVPGYVGNPVRKHIEVDQRERLKEEHFVRWLALWTETIDGSFKGPVAEEAKKKAALMMQLISTKIEWARQGKSIL
jgi:hemoglobin